MSIPLCTLKAMLTSRPMVYALYLRVSEYQEPQVDNFDLLSQGNLGKSHLSFKEVDQIVQESKPETRGLPWWPSGSDSMLPMQEDYVQFLVGELDPACRNKDPAKPNK